MKPWHDGGILGRIMRRGKPMPPRRKQKILKDSAFTFVMPIRGG